MNLVSPMFEHRRQTKKLVRIAKMLRELDAANGRKATPRRNRAALSRL